MKEVDVGSSVRGRLFGTDEVSSSAVGEAFALPFPNFNPPSIFVEWGNAKGGRELKLKLGVFLAVTVVLYTRNSVCCRLVDVSFHPTLFGLCCWRHKTTSSKDGFHNNFISSSILNNRIYFLCIQYLVPFSSPIRTKEGSLGGRPINK